jgi:hypothetical protein
MPSVDHKRRRTSLFVIHRARGMRLAHPRASLMPITRATFTSTLGRSEYPQPPAHTTRQLLTVRLISNIMLTIK